ncbi:hypothetical protein MKX03_021853 [Papaver bracteatum]|nr:hypothetical protein MKX03_021853 [Papaver bracteatum]
MATSSLLRSARSALNHADLASRCLPASTGTTSWTAIPLGQSCILFSKCYMFMCNSLYQYSPEQAKRREGKTLKVTDDILKFEAKIRALFKKWLSLSTVHHFDVEDRKAFEERFAIFKGKAWYVHQHNKKGDSTYTLGLTPFADLTREESGRMRYQVYPKKEVPESYLDVQ